MSFDTKKPPCASLENRPGCMQAALEIIGDKWTPLLLGQLVSGQKTFGELEQLLAGISPRTLSSRLNMLEEQSILVKNKYNDRPPRFKYDLSEKGKGLQQVLLTMADWGEKHGA